VYRLIRSIVRQLFGCLILFISGCKAKESYKSFIPTRQDSIKQAALIKRAFVRIEEAKKIIRDGDMITRTGNDFTSESLRSLNQRDKSFSHCGIASIEHDSIFIYHALGGDFNPDQKIRRDPLEIFAEPYTNKGIGIYRFDVADSIKKKFASTAQELFGQGIMFDMDFDLKTNDRMYCAEFAGKCFIKGGNGKLSFNHSHINQFEFIGVDDLFLQPLCKKQAQIVYK
jgi:hypothetical protein